LFVIKYVFSVADADSPRRNHTLRAAKVQSFLGLCKFLLLILLLPMLFYAFAGK